MSKNEKTYQNLWNAVKVVLRGKFITINISIKKDLKLIALPSTLRYYPPPKKKSKLSPHKQKERNNKDEIEKWNRELKTIESQWNQKLGPTTLTTSKFTHTHTQDTNY